MQNLLMIQGYAATPLVSADTAPSRAPAVGLLHRLVDAMTLWSIRHNTRRALAELDRHQLRDIGKTAEEARCEAAKPFWQA
jgi:uncharacterized protein YjiS (DUF1127 family)